ncbi:MAG TPA: alpha/beta fold hydrolase [Vicinamibacteria bacterium]|nr:alpha/beta fold hydrolase [Vicinamibacteria bacterium]
MWRVWLKRALLLALAALVLFIFGWVPWWLAGLATTRRFVYHDRENGGLTPAAFGLAFEDVAFRSHDGVEIRGWWVEAAPAKGTVVLVHGLNRSRIEMVRRVPFVHDSGWNALVIDLRHHGASGGTATTFGAREKDDVLAAARFARERSPGRVVLWGVSLGAASVVLAAAEDPQVAGVICDSSYRSLGDTLRHHLQLFRGFRWWLRLVPVWPVADEVMFWMRERGGFDPASVDVRAAAARLGGRPALFVANSEDVRMPKEIAFDLQAAAGHDAEVLIVPGRSHGGAWRDGTAAYQAAAGGLLQRAAQWNGRAAPTTTERGDP